MTAITWVYTTDRTPTEYRTAYLVTTTSGIVTFAKIKPFQGEEIFVSYINGKQLKVKAWAELPEPASIDMSKWFAHCECGGQAKLYKAGYHGTGIEFVVSCMACSRSSVKMATDIEAVEAWRRDYMPNQN